MYFYCLKIKCRCRTIKFLLISSDLLPKCTSKYLAYDIIHKCVLSRTYNLNDQDPRTKDVKRVNILLMIDTSAIELIYGGIHSIML